MPSAAFAQLAQICMDLAIAVDATALKLGVLDQTQQALIVFGACRLGLGAPSVVTTGMHFQNQAEVLDRIVRR